ncbi:hypothetical protein AB0C59_10535 [Streptomyces sp. NPDC048664]|uniref:hypothetical protein n=1 Tax=Streptomyces sp. NPDC048664 TaxID=3154505 RepID=UPI00342DABCA
MTQPLRTRAALGLTALAVTALGAAGLQHTDPAHTGTAAFQLTSVQSGHIGTEVNNTGSSYTPPNAQQ